MSEGDAERHDRPKRLAYLGRTQVFRFDETQSYRIELTARQQRFRAIAEPASRPEQPSGEQSSD